jgi:uncharacterized membrane protein
MQSFQLRSYEGSAREVDLPERIPRVRAWRSAAMLILITAFALRAFGLAARPLWFDEAIKYWASYAPLAQFSESMKTVLDPPLYSFLLHFWMLSSQHEFWLRYLSLLLSLIGILGSMVFVRELLGPVAGLVAGLLLAVSPPDIRFAQELGQYALMAALLPWNLLFLDFANRGRGRVWWVFWGITAVLVCYAHYGAAIIILATALIALLTSLRSRRWAAACAEALTGSAAFLLVLPLLFLIPRQLSGFFTSPAQAFHFTPAPLPVEIWQFGQLSRQILAYYLMGLQGANWPWPAIPEWAVAGLVLLTLSYGLWATRRTRLAPWLIGCVLLYYLASKASFYPFSYRYSLILAPFIIAGLAGGLTRLPRFFGIFVLTAIVLICVLVPREAPEDLRSVVTYWNEHREPSDATYVYYGAAPAFRYQTSLATPNPPAVPWNWHRGCWAKALWNSSYCAEQGIFYGEWIRSLDGPAKRASLLRTLGSTPNRLWLVFSHISAGEDQVLLSALANDYQTVQSTEASGASVILLKRP